MVELKEESLENNFLIFKNIPVYIEISEDDSFIYQYGNEKSEIIWKQIKNCCKQLADSIFY